MHQRARKTIVLATARKLHQRDRIRALPAPAVNSLITDATDETALLDLKKAGIEVVQVGKLEARDHSLAG
jgi:DeoR/GlpR family transcriptional regulator of sugar metabolism